MKLFVNCLLLIMLLFSSCSIPQYELFLNRDGSGVLHVKHDFVEGMAIMGQLMEVSLNDDPELPSEALPESISPIEMETYDDTYEDDSSPDLPIDEPTSVDNSEYESELSYEDVYEDDWNWDEEEEDEYELNKLQNFVMMIQGLSSIDTIITLYELVEDEVMKNAAKPELYSKIELRVVQNFESETSRLDLKMHFDNLDMCKELLDIFYIFTQETNSPETFGSDFYQSIFGDHVSFSETQKTFFSGNEDNNDPLPELYGEYEDIHRRLQKTGREKYHFTIHLPGKITGFRGDVDHKIFDEKSITVMIDAVYLLNRESLPWFIISYD